LKYKSLLAEVQMNSDRRLNREEDIWEDKPVDKTRERYENYVY